MTREELEKFSKETLINIILDLQNNESEKEEPAKDAPELAKLNELQEICEKNEKREDESWRKYEKIIDEGLNSRIPYGSFKHHHAKAQVYREIGGLVRLMIDEIERG